MDRLLLIAMLVVASSSTVRAQSIESYQRLARAMQVNNWRHVRHEVGTVLEFGDPPAAMRDALECMQAYLLEIALAEDARAEADRDLGAVARNLAALKESVGSLVVVYPRCSESPPDGVDPAEGARRMSELAYVIPELERASRMAGEASSASRRGRVVAEDLHEVFLEERNRLVAQIPLGPEDAWERTMRLWGALDTPLPQPSDWPAESQVPAIVTGAVTFGFGFVSFLASFTALSGRGLPALVAGGWGLTFGLIPAFASAWTWYKPSRALLLFSMAVTAVAATGGGLAVSRLGRNGRYLGRGFLIGSGVSMGWLIGGWAHYAFHRSSRRAWTQRLSLVPQVDRHGAGLVAVGRF